MKARANAAEDTGAGLFGLLRHLEGASKWQDDKKEEDSDVYVDPSPAW